MCFGLRFLSANKAESGTKGVLCSGGCAICKLVKG